MVIAVLLLIIVLGGIGFAIIWFIKAKSRKDNTTHDQIQMNTNQAYEPVTGGNRVGGVRGMEKERGEDSAETTNEPEYEVIN